MPFFNLPIGWYKKWFDKGKEVASDVGNSLSSGLDSIGDFFKDIFGGIGDFFKDINSYRWFVVIAAIFVAVMLLKKR